MQSPIKRLKIRLSMLQQSPFYDKEQQTQYLKTTEQTYCIFDFLPIRGLILENVRLYIKNTVGRAGRPTVNMYA